MTTPRKFSEKIANLQRKQEEEKERFNEIMSDVRPLTTTTRAVRALAVLWGSPH